MMIYLSMIDTPEAQSKFECLYRAYRGLLYHVAYEILQNHQDAEDAVHQAFLKIAVKIHSIDGNICPRTQGYVVSIVENKAIDLYRYRKRHDTVSLDGSNSTIVPVTISGHQGDLYLDNREPASNGLIWYDGNNQVIFTLSGNISGEELVKLAEGVRRK